MSQCYERFYRGFKVDVHVRGLTLKEAAQLKEFVDLLRAEREERSLADKVSGEEK